jgi:cyclopropane fatty-acyl-phospholipid synthase-like methyltransferase
MPRFNDKDTIIEHYDLVSPYYRSLWGEHLHHGYWIRGDESKEEAQLQLIEHLAEIAGIKPGRFLTSAAAMAAVVYIWRGIMTPPSPA